MKFGIVLGTRALARGFVPLTKIVFSAQVFAQNQLEENCFQILNQQSEGRPLGWVVSRGPTLILNQLELLVRLDSHQTKVVQILSCEHN